jgi:methionyl-tRNA formyltransferase
MKKNYAVLGANAWNRRDYCDLLIDENWFFYDSIEQLYQANKELVFRYAFFLHWSSIVPNSIIDNIECVCFHMTEVPFGRGGSPLQNLITRGIRETKLTALRMTDRLDAGPIYMKRPLTLEGGTAAEIYQRASRLSCEMAKQIAELSPVPVEQEGEVVEFKRRVSAQSEMPYKANNLLEVFDHIRMLDAEGYPKAFLINGSYKFEFTRAAYYHDELIADVRITKVDSKFDEQKQ